MHKVFAHGAARVGRNILQRRGIARRGVDDDRIVHRAVRFQRLSELGDGARLLSDGNIDADDALALLVDDGIEGDGGLAGLAVADDELALPAPDGKHRVDAENARFKRRVDALTVDDAGGGTFHSAVTVGADLSAAVDGYAERVYDAAEEFLAHGNTRRAPGAAHRAARTDARVVVKEDTADALLRKILHHAAHAAVEKQHLAVGRAGKSVHAGDAVAHGQNRADLLGKHIRRPREHRFLQKRDHIALRGSKLFQRALKLAQSAARAPVVDLRARLEAKAAGIGVALLPDERRSLAVLFGKKGQKSFLLRRCRALGRTKNGLKMLRALSHCSCAPPPCPGTCRKRPTCWKAPAFLPRRSSVRRSRPWPAPSRARARSRRHRAPS